jgi:hypothetical protein
MNRNGGGGEVLEVCLCELSATATSGDEWSDSHHTPPANQLSSEKSRGVHWIGKHKKLRISFRTTLEKKTFTTFEALQAVLRSTFVFYNITPCCVANRS